MGMAASQARFLSITARLTDNENSGQRLSFNKISLANQTEQLNADYNAALNQTKLTVLTGFNGSEEVYTDISFGTLTNYNSIAGGKQYCVTDKNGRMLVEQKYADAFEKGNGNYNIFLAELGYSQADLIATIGSDDEEQKNVSVKKIHEAWDKYLESVGKSIGDIFPLHPEGELNEASFGFDFFDGNSTILNGFPVVAMEATETTKTEYDYTKPIKWEKKKVDLGTNAATLSTPTAANNGNVNPKGNLSDAQNVVANTGLTPTDLEVKAWEDPVTGKTINGIQIKTAKGFEAVMAQFATNPKALTQNYILANDAGEPITIDLNSTSFAGRWGGISQFQGLFDGNGSTISNMRGSQGMFNDLYGQVQNLNLSGVTINAETDCLGGMAGYLADGASITNCNITDLNLNCNLRDINYPSGYSVQRASVGGLVGRNDGDISNTLVEGVINVPNATDSFSAIGGFIGLNANKDYQGSKVDNCYADVDIKLGASSGANSFSGAINNFVGNDINEMLITNCAAMGNITGNGSIQLVDLAGYGMALESDAKNSIAYNPRTGENVYWPDSKDPSYANAKEIANLSGADLDKFKNTTSDGKAVWVTDGDDYNNTTGQGDLKNNANIALNLNGLQGTGGEKWVDDLDKPIDWEKKTTTTPIPAETKVINFEGDTQEQRDLYDYAVSLTSQYFSEQQNYNGAVLKTAADKENVPYINFLKNIFQKMSSGGYYTYTTDATKTDPAVNPYYANYKFISEVENTTGTRVNRTPISDSKILEEMLRSGDLLLETYSSKDGRFVTTTLSDDVCIQEVEDERAIALVEAKYTSDMLLIENQDTKIDLQLKKLDTEHTALQTEYDSLKSVIDKNVEKSFNIFS